MNAKQINTDNAQIAANIQLLQRESTALTDQLQQLGKAGLRESSRYRHTERTLSRIQKALLRYEKGLYGQCVLCGEAISPARLHLLPHAELCLTCQRREEKRRE